VQQPYEIFVLGTDSHHFISVQAAVYPNPTASVVTLRIDTPDLNGFRYELYDLNGKLLGVERVVAAETAISMDKFPSAAYILKVYANKSQLKSFKILKNNR